MLFRNPVPQWGTTAYVQQTFNFYNVQNSPPNAINNTKLVNFDSNELVIRASSTNVVSKNDLVNCSNELINDLDNTTHLDFSYSTIRTDDLDTPSKPQNEIINDNKSLIRNQYVTNELDSTISTHCTGDIDKLSLAIYKKVTSFDDTLNSVLGTYKKHRKGFRPLENPHLHIPSLRKIVSTIFFYFFLNMGTVRTEILLIYVPYILCMAIPLHFSFSCN